MEKIVIAYVPVIHRGYLEFFQKYKGSTLYLLGEEFLRDFPKLGRDTRSLNPHDAKLEVEAHGIFANVAILNFEYLEMIKRSKVQIVMPNEDIMRVLAKEYFTEQDVLFANTFLRWDMQAVIKKQPVVSNRTISAEAFDREIMAELYEQTKMSPDWWRQIAACVVKDGKILLSAYNTHMPTEYANYILGDPRSNFDAGERIDLSPAAHAEAQLIARAAGSRDLSLNGASLYVTSFPCPTCAFSVAIAGVKKVYYVEGYSLLDAEQIFRKYDVEIVKVVMDNT